MASALQPVVTKRSDARLVLALLSAIFALNLIDRQILAILVEPIKSELELTDTAMGLLTGPAFALFYAAFGMPLAWMAERYGRVRIVAAACAVWSLCTMASAGVGSFAQLASARAGVGIGEAGSGPASLSLISDHFSPQRRGTAIAIYSISGIFGAAAGTAIGAWVGAEQGWRAAFLIAGGPGIVASLLLVSLVYDPRASKVARWAEKGAPLGFDAFFRSRLMILITMSGSLVGVLGFGVLTWLPALLMRDKGMSLAEVGTWYSVVSAVANGSGMLAGGLLADRLGRRRPQRYAQIPAVGMLIAAPMFVVAVLSPDWRLAVPLFALTGAATMLFGAPAMALIQNTLSEEHRTAGAAIFALVTTLVGMGLGPLLIGAASDAVGGAGSGLRLAMLGLVPLYVLTAALLLITARVLSAEVDRR